MTTFMDFRPFFNAMIVKMRANDEEKGDSWKDEQWYNIHNDDPEFTIDVDITLQKAPKKEVNAYFESLDVEELPDIANFCAMLYIRKKQLFPDQNEG